MELAEVVSPHVALPVVGVLVCALLVFAFGFKSPGQPPSFDFDDKKKGRRKQKTSKSHTGNGHVPQNVEEVPTKAQSVSKSPKSSTSSPSASAGKTTSPNNPKTSSTSKPESGKKQMTKKVSAGSQKPAPTEVKKVSSPEEDDAGWTTQVSRKGKKQRGKKDETFRSDDLDSPDEKSGKEDAAENTTSDVRDTEETMATENEAPPLEKREKKKKARKTPKGNAEEDMTKGAGDPLATPAPEPAIPEIVKPEPEAEKPEPEAEPEPEPEAEMEVDLEKETEEEEAAPESTKKSKPKRKDEIDEDFEIPDVYTKPPPIDPTPTATAKPTKSPKKNKKDKKRDLLNKQEAAVTESTNLTIQAEDKPESSSSISAEIAEASKPLDDISPSEISPSLETSCPVEPSTDTEPSSSSAPSTDNVTFDELGDSWIEAKVKTKKKKARREN